MRYLAGIIFVLVFLLATPTLASSSRIEFLLERAPAKLVMMALKPIFPRLTITPHPTMNGFYAQGPTKDLLAAKRMLSYIDF